MSKKKIKNPLYATAEFPIHFNSERLEIHVLKGGISIYRACLSSTRHSKIRCQKHYLMGVRICLKRKY